MRKFTISSQGATHVDLFFNSSITSLPLTDSTQVDSVTLLDGMKVFVIDSSTAGEIGNVYDVTVVTGDVTYALNHAKISTETMYADLGTVYADTIYPTAGIWNVIDTNYFSQKTVIRANADILVSFSPRPSVSEMLTLLEDETLSLQNPLVTPLYVYGAIGVVISIYNNAKFLGTSGGARVLSGNGSPEGVVTSIAVCGLYTDNLTGVIYINTVKGVNTGRQVFQTGPAVPPLH